jgi:hypothetical protein
MSYQTKFLEAKAAYDRLQTFDVDAKISALDNALYTYSINQTDGNRAAVQAAFSPIGQYYSQLTDINSNLQDFLDEASQDLVKLNTSEERYNERIHPEESVHSREVMLGIYPNLRIESIPYILAVSVFMASLTVFLIFQMNGVSGQLNLPPALVTWWKTPSVGPPLYRNPIVLGGLIVLLIAAVIVFAVLYFKK